MTKPHNDDALRLALAWSRADLFAACVLVGMIAGMIFGVLA